MFKSLIFALSVAVLAAGVLPSNADARRIGGGGSAGMQRSMPSRPPAAVPPRPTQAAPAAPAPAGAIPPAAAPKRSWMGPLAGLAAGLGIAALMSHFGMGAGMGNLLMMVLLAVVAFMVIRFLMNQFGRPNIANTASRAGSNGSNGTSGMQFAGSGAQPPYGGGAASTGSGWGQPSPSASAAAPVLAAAATGMTLPPGFDTPGFERIAKMIFIRMQAANDSADLNDLRSFTTPEMFASVRLDLQDRGAKAQRTDVVHVDAEVLDVSTEGERQIVSVRFHGLIREEENAPAAPFDEIWHLVKSVDGAQQWAIAGIQQSS